jgi:hypothetical protein
MFALRRLTIVRLLFAAIAFSCSSEDAVTPIPLACFAVSLGTWAPALPEPLPPVPATIRLTDSLGVDGLESGRMQVMAVPAESESYRWAWWDRRGGDSLRVVFSTGFTGVTLHLTRRGSDFEGSAAAFFDFTYESPEATARLTRTDCP